MENVISWYVKNGKRCLPYRSPTTFHLKKQESGRSRAYYWPQEIQDAKLLLLTDHNDEDVTHDGYTIAIRPVFDYMLS